jgi:hypothetical protein
MQFRFANLACVVGFSWAALTVACGSSDTDTKGTPPTSTPTVAGIGEHKSVQIKASEGGSLAVTGGTISIPPGALASDLEVTVDVKDKSGYAGASDIAINVFDYGPNGTKFLKPVAMELDLQGVAVPDGKTAKIAFFDGSAWQPLEDSAVAGGKVTATTTHFTPFTVVFVGGAQTGGGCGAFTACGGDLTGTWTFTAGCATVPTSTLGSPWSTCATSSISATVDQTGTITFNADKSYAVDNKVSISFNGDLPKSCLSSGQTCQSIGDPSKGDVVSDDGTDCHVTGQKNDSTTNETGTYSTTGTTFTTTKTGSSTPGATISYCVTGNTLVAEQTDKNGVTFHYTATK